MIMVVRITLGWDLDPFERSFWDRGSVQFSSVAQSCLTLRTHGLQHARLPCPSPSPKLL